MKSTIIAVMLLATNFCGSAFAAEPYFALAGSKRLGWQTESLAIWPVDGATKVKAVQGLIVVGHPSTSWSLLDLGPDALRDWFAPTPTRPRRRPTP